MPTENQPRTCMGCGLSGSDLSGADPRHQVDLGGINTYWHFECHSRATGCAICAGILAQSDQ